MGLAVVVVFPLRIRLWVASLDSATLHSLPQLHNPAGLAGNCRGRRRSASTAGWPVDVPNGMRRDYSCAATITIPISGLEIIMAAPTLEHALERANAIEPAHPAWEAAFKVCPQGDIAAVDFFSFQDSSKTPIYQLRSRSSAG